MAEAPQQILPIEPLAPHEVPSPDVDDVGGVLASGKKLLITRLNRSAVLEYLAKKANLPEGDFIDHFLSLRFPSLDMSSETEFMAALDQLNAEQLALLVNEFGPEAPKDRRAQMQRLRKEWREIEIASKAKKKRSVVIDADLDAEAAIRVAAPTQIQRLRFFCAGLLESCAQLFFIFCLVGCLALFLTVTQRTYSPPETSPEKFAREMQELIQDVKFHTKEAFRPVTTIQPPSLPEFHFQWPNGTDPYIYPFVYLQNKVNDLWQIAAESPYITFITYFVTALTLVLGVYFLYQMIYLRQVAIVFKERGKHDLHPIEFAYVVLQFFCSFVLLILAVPIIVFFVKTLLWFVTIFGALGSVFGDYGFLFGVVAAIPTFMKVTSWITSFYLWILSGFGITNASFSLKVPERPTSVTENLSRIPFVRGETLNQANPAMALPALLALLRIVDANKKKVGTAFIARDSVFTATHNLNGSWGPDFRKGPITDHCIHDPWENQYHPIEVLGCFGINTDGHGRGEICKLKLPDALMKRKKFRLASVDKNSDDTPVCSYGFYMEEDFPRVSISRKTGFTHRASTTPGVSGAPLLNQAGHVIGVHYGGEYDGTNYFTPFDDPVLSALSGTPVDVIVPAAPGVSAEVTLPEHVTEAPRREADPAPGAPGTPSGAPPDRKVKFSMPAPAIRGSTSTIVSPPGGNSLVASYCSDPSNLQTLRVFMVTKPHPLARRLYNALCTHLVEVGHCVNPPAREEAYDQDFLSTVSDDTLRKWLKYKTDISGSDWDALYEELEWRDRSYYRDHTPIRNSKNRDDWDEDDYITTRRHGDPLQGFYRDDLFVGREERHKPRGDARLEKIEGSLERLSEMFEALVSRQTTLEKAANPRQIQQEEPPAKRQDPRPAKPVVGFPSFPIVPKDNNNFSPQISYRDGIWRMNWDVTEWAKPLSSFVGRDTDDPTVFCFRFKDPKLADNLMRELDSRKVAYTRQGKGRSSPASAGTSGRST